MAAYTGPGQWLRRASRTGRKTVGSIAVLAGAVVVSILHASIAAAQPYPSKAVRVITSNSAGGTSDIFVRALGDELQRSWSQPLVIENRPGGGMNIAGRACAEAPNDGYTLCILPGETLVLNQFTLEQFSQFLHTQRVNAARLIRESGFAPR